MNKRKKSRAGLLVVLLLMAYFSWKYIDQQKTLNRYNEEFADLQNKISEETTNEEYLQKQKEILFSDENIERIAREKLGMVKPSEKVFVDVDR